MKTENKATVTTILMVAAIMLFAANFATAEPAAPESLTEVASSSRDLSELSAQSLEARGGNVTEVNINALSITQSWQGLYGDISGEITLDDGSNNTFYNWSTTSVSGQVYATRASSITWSNVNCSTAVNITSEETYLGHVAADGDSVTNTYSLTTHPGFNVTTGAEIFTDTCPSTNAFTNNASQSADWVQVLLHDQTDNVVYSTLINDSTTGFNSNTYDFQLLVGENEHTGNIGTTTYYVWVQLE
ncbi:MAG: hypothetical protein OXR66_07235 [Candidatus Woesearchaeota archaeon]|nr:hypothetical protein [Candidatus Woesearchaeota archaeon]